MSGTTEIKGSVSYITGSHALKFGFSDFWGIQTYNSPELNNAYNIRMLNGVPNQITERQNQYMGIKGGVRAEMGAFVQDRWTVNRLTVNAGLRFDYNHTGWDEYHFGPGPLVPNRNFTVEEEDFYKFKDFSPRVGAAYDIFGTGRTAVKVNIGKYGLALDPTQGVPARDRIVPRVTRSWIDADRDFTPDCDLINPLAQSPATTGSIDTCGQISDLRFGSEIPRATTYDPAVLTGWNARPNNWEFSTSVQHEVITGLGVDVGYFRRSYRNFTVSQNRAVTPADFTTYSIPVPVDPRLPNSGQTLGGLRDVNPNKFGQVDTYVTKADNFGGQSEVFNGVDLTANARMGDLILRGGISTGKVTQDTCAIVTTHPEVTVTQTIGAPPVGTQLSTSMCHVETPFLTQGKLFATYNVPKIDVGIAATYQSLPGPLVAANYIATNAVIVPSLGRPLSGGVANTTINLVTPGTMYGERLNQLDLRFSKDFRFGAARVPGELRHLQRPQRRLRSNRQLRLRVLARSDGDPGSAAVQDQRAVRFLKGSTGYRSPAPVSDLRRARVHLRPAFSFLEPGAWSLEPEPERGYRPAESGVWRPTSFVGVRAALGCELLRPAARGLGRVEDASRVHAEPMDVLERARRRSRRAPRLEQLPVQVVLQHHVGGAGRDPQMLVCGHHDEVRPPDVRPLIQEPAGLVEHLDAAVVRVGHVDAPIPIDVDAVGQVELAWPAAFHAPRRHVLAVPVEFDDARVHVAVGHEEAAVGQPRQIGRAAEVRLVGAADAGHPERHHQLLPVVGELEDLLPRIVHHPDVPLRIVGADLDAMRPAPAGREQVIVLAPAFEDLAVGVGDDDAVAQLGLLPVTASGREPIAPLKSAGRVSGSRISPRVIR